MSGWGQVCRLAYAIKDPSSPSVDFDTAATETAALIPGPCWLIPIPDSTGDTRATAILASAIARHVASAALASGAATTAQVAKVIRRTRPVESQCSRHKLALGPIPPEEHYLARTAKYLTLMQTYFICAAHKVSGQASRKRFLINSIQS